MVANALRESAGRCRKAWARCNQESQRSFSEGGCQSLAAVPGLHITVYLVGPGALTLCSISTGPHWNMKVTLAFLMTSDAALGTP